MGDGAAGKMKLGVACGSRGLAFLSLPALRKKTHVALDEVLEPPDADGAVAHAGEDDLVAHGEPDKVNRGGSRDVAVGGQLGRAVRLRLGEQGPDGGESIERESCARVGVSYRARGSSPG